MDRFISFRLFCQAVFLFAGISLSAQTPVEGYVFETNNGGFIQQAVVAVYKLQGNKLVDTLDTDEYGHFAVNLEPGKYRIVSGKDIFEQRQDTVTVKNTKLFLKFELRRKKGYLFDARIIETGLSQAETDRGLQGATIEVYNRTTDQVESVYKLKTMFNFQHHFRQGNRYTVLVRKPGFIGRRIEVDLNTNGCDFCIYGISNQKISDETKPAGGELAIPMSADIALERSMLEKHIAIPLVAYDSHDGEEQNRVTQNLKSVASMIRDNPDITFELACHTDARGNDDYNLQLSQKRAEQAREQIIAFGGEASRIVAKGYGETQLFNKCGNGVECPEEEHLQNRRTELIIKDILPEYIWLPIEQIIEEEKIAERARAEQNQKMDIERPAVIKPKNKKLPEANNSVPLPEKQQNNKSDH